MTASFRKSRFAFLAVAGVLVFVLVPAAIAGKGSGGGKPSGGGGTGGGSTISGPVLVGDANGDGQANWNDTVTFTVSTSATSQPYVDLKCYQGGALVLHGSAGFFAGALNSGYDFTLMSGAWPGGSATCTAALGMYGGKRGTWQQLASASFSVAG